MLVVSRKNGQSVVCNLEDGRQIEFRVVDIDRNKIRVGITAPRTIGVFRQELLDEAATISQAKVAKAATLERLDDMKI